MKNTIATRIYDFLKDYPPFNLLEADLLKAYCTRVVVQYYKPQQSIFKQGEQPGKHIYVVREGAVHLFREQGSESTLIDECDEGDTFGIRPILAQQPYALTARTEEESLIYAIPADGLREEVERNPKLAFYLATSFAAGARKQEGNSFKGRIFIQQEGILAPEFRLTEVQSLATSKTPVTCTASTTIRNAAIIMSDNEVGSIIVVNAKEYPIGIITDRDLRKKVVTGLNTLESEVAQIMTSPVVTIAPDITVADVQILMIKHRIHHLCITEDGTPKSKAIGVISEHDLLVIQGNNPAILIREIHKSNEAKELRNIRQRAEQLLENYIYQEVSIAFISTIMTEVNDAIIERCIQLSEEELRLAGAKQPEASFCWLALGSEGRQEQLLRTDQDNALVFENIEDEATYTAAKNYYLQLAGKVTQKLNVVGFAYCPADMMASNPKWCMSLQEWKDLFSEWVNTPNNEALLHSNIFFDYRPVYGNHQLAEQLTDHIFTDVDKQRIFLAFMAKSALQNPAPLSFFRNFVVEKGGEHKDEFDIKKRAMMPLADAARVLIIEAKVGKINNTFRRFEKLAELDAANRDLFEQAAEAYEILMRYRTLQGLKNSDSGRYFKPSELNKLQRNQLRNSFRPIDELQSLLTLRFQLSYIR